MSRKAHKKRPPNAMATPSHMRTCVGKATRVASHRTQALENLVLLCFEGGAKRAGLHAYIGNSTGRLHKNLQISRRKNGRTVRGRQRGPASRIQGPGTTKPDPYCNRQ
jgi:hypothetical protein